MPVAKALGHNQITVSTTGSTLDTYIGGAGIPRGASHVVIQVGATNGIRFRDDGTAPTAAIGIAVPAATTYNYTGNLKTLRLIRSGGADATVDLAFYDHNPAAF